MCALEAMSLGVPIVTTPTDGLVYLLEGKNCGYLSDKNEELASFSAKIILDNELHNQLSKEALMSAHIINDTKVYKGKIQAVL